ncbi:MAG: RNA polymerase sigma factor [Bacteroidales bacterium]
MSNGTLQQQLLGLQDRLFSFALSMTENREDAKDLLQETTLRVLDNQDKFVADTNFKAWVFTLMRNIFINNYRKLVREQRFVSPSDELYQLNIPADSGYSSPESVLSIGEMNDAVKHLEEEIRAPFLMHVLGFKYYEIAEKLQIPIGTVKSRIFLARKQLMVKLKEYNEA